MNEETTAFSTLNENSQMQTAKNSRKNKFCSNELSFKGEKQKHCKRRKKHKNPAEDVTGEEDYSPPWRRISGVLGVLCLLLMAAAVVVAVLTANSSSESTSSAVQQKGPHHHPCPKNWVWFRCRCYYFSKEALTWRESQRACSSVNSSLIKINREEMDFFTLKHFFWVGVYYNGTSKQWLWENDLAQPSDIVQDTTQGRTLTRQVLHR
ncbi:killer cell lectin-like receptor subfamily E member 1 [Nannospalax galili]|uniref:killer cell lectin-like receptor subfamily E member 1 n=1 Tax=Nannospalax galili TaxID=1026970 RepID=UPI000819BC8B|nr:killer cell lectin-like receptor subfamily E member 1 [Nannospalax galili]